MLSVASIEILVLSGEYRNLVRGEYRTLSVASIEIMVLSGEYCLWRV